MTDPSAHRSSADRLVDLVRNVHLTPTQRSIVRTLIAHVDRVPYLSTTELAELAHVSQPSVTRLATALGFKGYPHLRAALRESAPATPGADAPVNDWQRSIDFEIAALQQVRDGVRDQTQVRRIAEAFMASRPLVVVGHRASASVTTYFTYFASRIHDDVRTTSASGADVDLLHQAAAAGATAALVVAVPRYPAETLRAIETARELGLTVVGVTDTVVSPIARLVDDLLIAPVDSSLVFDSYASPMILLNVVLAAMAEVDPDDTQTRFERFDVMVARHGVFHGNTRPVSAE